MREDGGINGLGIEAICAVDEGDGTAFASGSLKDGVENGETAGGVSRSADLREGSLPEATAEGIVQRKYAGGKKQTVPGCGGGKTLSQKFPQLVDCSGVFHKDPRR